MDNESHKNEDAYTNTKYENILKLKETKTKLSEKLIRYDWSQTSGRIFVTLYKKNLDEDNLLYYIKDGFLEILINMSDDEIYLLEKRLFSKIIPNQTRICITPMKIEINLQKEQEDLEWPQLEKNAEKEKENMNGISKNKDNLLNPFSGKSTHEWDQLTKSIKEDEEEGNIDTFFRKIYNEGDDDTKRAMIKSFQTSRGTVLSTNWKDVQHKNYEKDKSLTEEKK
ncbi:SGS domain containing protein [Plasmodium gonderi]|uniref:SGS domain containing protein n=1 Tax=Plasmodium gonderi TaxID=77519 RepID=A0A1Y1JGQ3_PLAGO|nr:SGS domain containing protein [Plasmodium gonderi]GAW80397.1 SGS domain containing protein [Plasmodium gonderi]